MLDRKVVILGLVCKLKEWEAKYKQLIKRIIKAWRS